MTLLVFERRKVMTVGMTVGKPEPEAINRGDQGKKSGRKQGK
jgi:hypothetical protein